MTCCRCSRTGTCINCKCAKSSKKCEDCLPGQLGRCSNATEPNTTTISGNTVPLRGNSLVVSDSRTNGSDPSLTSDDSATAPQFSTNYEWGRLNSKQFHKAISSPYEETVFWKRNIFLIPSGRSGKTFVQQLARLFRAYADASELEDIAMKAIVVYQILLSQKPCKSSRSKDHVRHLQRRLTLWQNGDIEELLSEGRCIQSHLSNHKNSTKNNIARVFSNLMFQGKVRNAINLLSRNSCQGILNPDDTTEEIDSNEVNHIMTVKEILRSLHP